MAFASVFFLGEAVERGVGRAIKTALVLLLLDGENVAGPLGAGEQILAVISIEKFAERLNKTNYHQEIVFEAEWITQL